MAEEKIENIEELEYADVQSEPITAVVQTRLNVRKAPTLNAEVVKILNGGDVVEILEDGAEWVKISDGYEKILKMIKRRA